ncbi:PEP-CTERM sorting domain-containing protein [Bythopirellula goksoeyrii]|uniref:Ice-binding protein C-terminal domain-containing protein n=1 Tax=Bythopirellula goksoeyrii TaxID=1400387 RepID=A0A5B9Q5G9_9BACT|nr:PEP-CTERM sorting domain-containing protein [Bythopirellula goksoeyrii]QEG34227.1 hypothetical protein Pr1d_15000 [Bythopirellula goksoeyrii]
MNRTLLNQSLFLHRQYSFLFLAIIVQFAFAQTGNAGTVCSAGIANNLTANNGCETGSTNNDNPIPGQVNADTMFGFSDWVFAEKFEFPVVDEDIDIGLTITGGDISGTWSINNVWGSFQDIMLILKGGSGNNTQEEYVGYLLVTGDTSGAYTTPFFNANNGNAKEISHVSAYVRGVPEPATWMLLGLALGTLSLRRAG